MTTNPPNWIALTERGVRSRDAGKPDEATRDFRAAIQLAPQEMWPRIHLAVTLRDGRQFEAANDALVGALEVQPAHLHALMEAAETARQWGKTEIAIGYYERLIPLDPDHVEYYLFLVGLLKLMQRPRSALDVLGQLLKVQAGKTNALAEIRALVRQFPEMQEDARAIMERETGHAAAFTFVPIRSTQRYCGPAPAPLNQVYRVQQTCRDHLQVRQARSMFDALSVRSAARKHDGAPAPWGRSYDYAVLRSMGIDFTNRRVADLGARDGYFGPWLTGEAAEVYVSDYFQLWEHEWHATERPPDTDSFSDWQRRWREMAPKPERLFCERQDITNLTYPDHHFDITICTSVIEHMWPNDIKGMAEIVRVTKVGGIIAMSTEMSPANGWHGGTYWYNEATFLARLIEPHPVEFLGPWDFALDHPANDSAFLLQVDELRRAPGFSAVFALRRLPDRHQPVSRYVTRAQR